jgi:hypothetical protein
VHFLQRSGKSCAGATPAASPATAGESGKAENQQQ